MAEQVAGQKPQTQFGRAMSLLGVELILANSPQAKGRVERRNGLLQDRLVKALRLRGISDLKSFDRNVYKSRIALEAGLIASAGREKRLRSQPAPKFGHPGAARAGRYATSRMPPHVVFPYMEQPQNSCPACWPVLARRSTMSLPQRGHLGRA